jgi:hypothetical protein
MLEENFDIVEKLGTHNNFKEQRNTKAYKLLVENKVDTNEYLNIDKENGAGVYKTIEKDSKVQEADENNFINAFLEFGQGLSNSEVVTSIKSRLPEGLINVTDFGTNIFNTFDKLFSLDPQYERSEIFTNWSNNLEKVRKNLQETRKDVEGKMSDMVGMVFQDAPATFVIYKALKKAKIKDRYAVPLSFGIGYGISFDEKDPSIFFNSEDISNIKHFLNILPDTPEDQLADDVIEIFEGTAMAALIPGVIKSFKFIKKNVPSETVTDVGRLLATGTVAAGTVIVANQAKGGEIPAIPEPININEKPVIDVSDPKRMEMNALSALSKLLPPDLVSKGIKRIVSGISRQKGDVLPNIKQQIELAEPLIKSFKKDKNVLNFKVDDSFGKFQSLERSLDVEAIVTKNYEKKKLFKTAVNLAAKHNQDSVFVSEQVLGKTKKANPAIQINFDVAKSLDEANAIAEAITKVAPEIQGFTFKTKLLDMKEPIIVGTKKGNQTFEGFRTHFIPEYSNIDKWKFIEKVRKIESFFESGKHGKTNTRVEFYLNSIINKEDYGKFK